MIIFMDLVIEAVSNNLDRACIARLDEADSATSFLCA